MFAIYDIHTGEITGFAEAEVALTGDYALMVIEELIPEERIPFTLVIDGEIAFDDAAYLDSEIAKRKRLIKQEAGKKIEGMNWRVTRAKERAHLGVEQETLLQVYKDREATRRASDRAERELKQLTDLDAVRAFTWQVKDVDYEGLES